MRRYEILGYLNLIPGNPMESGMSRGVVGKGVRLLDDCWVFVHPENKKTAGQHGNWSVQPEKSVVFQVGKSR